LGLKFKVVHPKVEEIYPPPEHLRPNEYAQAMAYMKARSVTESLKDEMVIGADTVVACAGEIIGKPKDREHARRILRKVRGNRHQVITGIALVDAVNLWRMICSDSTELYMKKMTDDDIEKYLDEGPWQGKAGAYAIQDMDDPFVEVISGSFTNVVGLPEELLEKMIRAFEEVHDKEI
jgi:septum formation protein